MLYKCSNRFASLTTLRKAPIKRNTVRVLVRNARRIRDPKEKHFESVDNQVEFIETVKKDLEIKNVPDDWYNVTNSKIIEKGGEYFLKRHEGTLWNAMRTLYPDVPWVPWKWVSERKEDQTYWKERDYVIKYLKTIIEEFDIKEPVEWHRVPAWHLIDLFNLGALHQDYRDILKQGLRKCHRGFRFNFSNSPALLDPRVIEQKTTTQWLLVKMLQRIFPNTEILEDFAYAEDPIKILNPDIDRPISSDIYIPEFKLAIEFQGHHQFHAIKPEKRRDRDKLKKGLLKDKGISYIWIPYWWRGDIDRIKATLNHYRPDLVKQRPLTPKGKPVTPYIIEKVITRLDPDEPINPNFTLAQQWPPDLDPTGYWLAEDLVGVRCVWDGEQLTTSTDIEVEMPYRLYKHLLKLPMDKLPEGYVPEGVLYVERGMQRSVTAAKFERYNDWRDVKFRVFNLQPVAEKSSTMTAEESHEILRNVLLKEKNDFVSLVEYEVCKGEKHMEKVLNNATELGGEGVVLRDSKAPYIRGSTDTLLRVMSSYDHEVLMVGKGDTGFLLVKMPSGIHMQISCSAYDYKNPPDKESVLQVKHSGFYRDGRMKKPMYWKKVQFTKWEKVMDEYEKSLLPPEEEEDYDE